MEKLLTAEEERNSLTCHGLGLDHADREQSAIPYARLGKAVRFRPEDVRSFIEA